MIHQVARKIPLGDFILLFLVSSELAVTMRRMPGTLYIVATPIGNLEDITQRALRVLGEVALIACEDTRHTKGLLNHFGIKTKTISYHEHNERERVNALLKLLLLGQSVAIVSDAGTPLVSDPGFRIVEAAIAHDIPIVPIPGPNAAVAALVASGLPSDQFVFAGFLPARANARRTRLEELRAIPATLIFYEAPHRITAALQDALLTLGDREAVIARELTKLHEEFTRGRLSDLAALFSQASAIRGEIVLLISGSATNETVAVESSPSLADRVRQLESEGLEPKAALKKAARESGLKRSEAYRRLIAQKNFRNR